MDMNKVVKLGRNERCHCGSGRKYKICHLAADELDRSRAMFVAAAGREENISLQMFTEIFPDIAATETRHFWPTGRDPEKDPIQIAEYYCTDPSCDCKRVLLTLFDLADPDPTPILTVGYAFNRNDPEPGPYIDPLNHLTPQGRDYFPFICDLLDKDSAYVNRLQKHYEMIKAHFSKKQVLSKRYQ